MYFSEHKQVVEIDEKGHTDRNQNKENERQANIKERVNCKFYSVNPDVNGYNIFLEISKMQNCITQSNEENLKRKFYSLGILHKKYRQHYKKWLNMINIALNKKTTTIKPIKNEKIASTNYKT